MGTLSALPRKPSVPREMAQEENAALFKAVLNPKHKKVGCRNVLEGKTEDAMAGLAWRWHLGRPIRKGDAGMLANPRCDRQIIQLMLRLSLRVLEKGLIEEARTVVGDWNNLYSLQNCPRHEDGEHWTQEPERRRQGGESQLNTRCFGCVFVYLLHLCSFKPFPGHFTSCETQALDMWKPLLPTQLLGSAL